MIVMVNMWNISKYSFGSATDIRGAIDRGRCQCCVFWESSRLKCSRGWTRHLTYSQFDMLLVSSHSAQDGKHSQQDKTETTMAWGWSRFVMRDHPHWDLTNQKTSWSTLHIAYQKARWTVALTARKSAIDNHGFNNVIWVWDAARHLSVETRNAMKSRKRAVDFDETADQCTDEIRCTWEAVLCRAIISAVS